MYIVSGSYYPIRRHAGETGLSTFTQSAGGNVGVSRRKAS